MADTKADAPTPTGPSSSADATWSHRKLLAHFLIVTLGLVALVPIIGTDSVWSADVGAQLAQAQRLSDGNGWYFDHPFPEADPAGDWFGYHLSGRVDGRLEHTASSDTKSNSAQYVVFAKHPTFTWLVVGLLRVGGLNAVMLLSAVCTSLAAAAVGILTKWATSTRTAVVALWITATLSPLAFDAFLGYAHTLAAALAAWATVAAVAQIRTQRLRHFGLPVAALFCMVGPLFRSESTLAGLALGLGLLLSAGSWTAIDQRRLSRLGGILLVLSTVFGFFLDRAISIPVDAYTGTTAADVPWLAGRFQGFWSTWLQPRSGAWQIQDVLLIATPALWYVSARSKASKLRFDRQFPATGRSLSDVALWTGSSTVVVWCFLSPRQIVPGLVLAFPLLALLAATRAKSHRNPVEVIAVTSFILFAGAVILTQYPQGGTSEWGGRYFAAGIPLVVVGFASHLQRFVELARQRSALLVIIPFAASLVLMATGLTGLRQSKQLVVQLQTGIEEAVVQSEARSDQSLPRLDEAAKRPAAQPSIVISTSNAVGRLTWEIVEQNRWLLVPPTDLDLAVRELEALRVDQIVVVAERHQRTARTIGAYNVVKQTSPWPQSPFEILTFSES